MKQTGDGFGTNQAANGQANFGLANSTPQNNQKKKVIFKREQDDKFGFLEIDTSIKLESRLKMRRMLKANIMGNKFDLSEKFSRACQQVSGSQNKQTNNQQSNQQAIINSNGITKSSSDRLVRTNKKTLTLVNNLGRKHPNRGDGQLLGKRTGLSKKRPGSRPSNVSAPKQFVCHLESCAKVFTDRASLKKHMTVHGDKLVSKNFF